MIQTLDQMLFFCVKSILLNKITFLLTFLKLLADTIPGYSTFFPPNRGRQFSPFVYVVLPIQVNYHKIL